MNDDKIGRRDAMKRALQVLGAAAAAPVVLAGCGGGEEELSCTDTQGLTPAEVQMRQNQSYVDHSPKPSENCANCNFYEAAQAGQCGSCSVIAGPIHPEGYCNLWAAKA
jgi:hypothetical protein